jgi:hypothetical protein
LAIYDLGVCDPSLILFRHSRGTKRKARHNRFLKEHLSNNFHSPYTSFLNLQTPTDLLLHSHAIDELTRHSCLALLTTHHHRLPHLHAPTTTAHVQKSGAAALLTPESPAVHNPDLATSTTTVVVSSASTNRK